MEKTENLKKVTNVKQFEKLVQIMEANPDVARGFTSFPKTKTEYGQKWKEYADILNKYGPPSRDGEGWLKVWNDLKSKVKKKIVFNKKEINTTGGEPNKILYLSTLEETVDRLLGIQQTVVPSVDTIGFSSTILILTQTLTTPTTGNFTNIETTRGYNQKKDEKREFLKKQTKYMKFMEEHTKNILEIKKKKFKLYEKYIETKTNLLKKKMKLIELNTQQASLRLQYNSNY